MTTTLASLALPRITEIGRGCSRRLPEVLARLGVGRPVVVTDESLLGAGVLRVPLQALDAAGIDVEIFTGVSPDPSTEEVDALLALLQQGRFDCIIAIGGGSPMDAAKAAAVQASYAGRPLRELKAPFSVDTSALPLICVPTTAGTGSEVTRFTIITDTATNEKMLITGTGCVPVAALVDAELTVSMPARVTADTGLDALTHGLEAYISLRHNPHADVFAVSGVRRVLENLRTAYANPSDIDTREEMLLGALHAGMAFSASSVALIHGMSRPMGAVFHVAHGMANAMLLPSVMTWTLPHAQDRFAELARQTLPGLADVSDAAAADHFYRVVTALARDVAVPTLSQRGVDRGQWFGAITTMAEQAIASGSPANNPGDPQPADIEHLYANLWA